ncbi:flavin monoamine oxidase family protein [Paraburkholderia oxyphila]|uniref:flavin monoamine oxidase family protein n=1 Tax=Paraburkholderia oxyphila TaxID=614212 RepID=UPI000A4F42E8|nr:FAD-dependent oxidoreductase [Paraburkholderia oxyphila]
MAIVGGGLSGLYAALLLEQKGWRDYVLLEAREALGGRILPLRLGRAPSGASNCFDLGPTWFWPSVQPKFAQLTTELGLHAFAQHASGDLLVERAGEGEPRREAGYFSQDGMRIIGGMNALMTALQDRVDLARIHTDQRVCTLRVAGDEIELTSQNAAGWMTTWRAQHVLMALPPRLADTTLEFVPRLPPELANSWRAAATWMAPHAKYLAVYDKPFWRARGLSGEARSARGPLAEIHNASMPGAQAALFGFFGIPAQVRANVPEDILRAHCRAQLSRLFGPEAAEPLAEGLKDWASDPLTASALDLAEAATHGSAAPARAESGAWQGRVTGIASEWSLRYPGYLAGAVDAAERGVASLLGAANSTRKCEMQ